VGDVDGSGDVHGGDKLVPRAVNESPVLRAKLRAPAPPAHLVDRQRLYDRLDELVTRQVTTVVAPAGFGKSVLLASWAPRHTGCWSWLSLDEGDSDGWQFWTDAIEAISSLPGVSCDAARQVLRQPRGFTQVAIELLNDLDRSPVPSGSCVLVIDDAHVVDGDDELTRSFGVFLQHLPDWLHVVLSSRREVRVPADRLRAQGRLADLHTAELRFSAEEASRMLDSLAPSLPVSVRENTATRVEGWAAGVQLAALAARSRDIQASIDPSMLDTDRLIDDFVSHEVLGTEQPEMVKVLLDVSVVERVNAGLASRLTGRGDAVDLLQQAETRGLFVSRIAGTGWFQMHSLVRSALCSHLARRSPERFEECHVRAAQWFEEIGEIPVALEHWHVAGRHGDALRLLAATYGDLYDAGREATIINTIRAIPATTRSADVGSMLDYASCLLLVDRRAYIDAAEEAAWWVEHYSDDTLLHARSTMLQSRARLLEGDWIEAGELARRSMVEFGEEWWRDQLGRFGPNQVGREIAYSERWSESAEDVREAELALGRDPPRRAALEATRAVGHALAGRPVEALRIAAGVRRTARVTNKTIMRVELDLAELIAHRELGDSSRSFVAQHTLADAPAETMLWCKVLAMCELAEAHLDATHFESALAELGRAQKLATEQALRRPIADRLARVGATVALATGTVDQADHRAAEIEDTFWGPTTRARVWLASGRADDALDQLDQAVPRCPRHEVVTALLRSRATHCKDTSLECAAAALATAAAHGMLQTVASEGRDDVDVIERAAWGVPPEWMDRLRKLVAAGVAMPAAGDRHQVEQLTAREREILRYLPSRLTGREIANECYVSLNTLKFHLRVIYRKLGVTSRAEAAARARQLMSR
jgi:LuxR family transcriptional regulator, maltose regulon positive regulatory protein